MKSPGSSTVQIVIAALIAAACTSDLPTATTPADLTVAKGGNGPAAYTSVDLGALLGSYSSSASSVNDAGDIVGRSGPGAFAIVAGAVISLPGNGNNAAAISNSSPRYVVGDAGGTSQPVRWSISEGVASQPAPLALGSATYGFALGVNDAGDAVGRAGVNAAIWNADGDLAVAFLPDGFVRGEGRDINNDGHAVFVFNIFGPEWSGARAYLRLASGTLVPLPPLSGDVTSYANSISEVQGNTFHIAGSSRSGPETFRSVRWTIDVTTEDIVSTAVRSENSHALGVSNGGAIAGFVEPPPRTLKFKAFLWRGTELLTLSPPKGAKDPKAWAISPSGEFVAGEAYFGTSRHAVRWTIIP